MPARLHNPPPDDQGPATVAALTGCTCLDPSTTVSFCLPELHAVALKPHVDRGSARNAVIVEIPEASNTWIAHALKMADKLRCRLPFLCDSCGQANAIAEPVARQRPQHRGVPLERAGAGLWGAPT